MSRLEDEILVRRGDKIIKRTILWALVLIVAFTSGFGVGAALWEFDAYNYIRGESTQLEDEKERFCGHWC